PPTIHTLSLHDALPISHQSILRIGSSTTPRPTRSPWRSPGHSKNPQGRLSRTSTPRSLLAPQAWLTIRVLTCGRYGLPRNGASRSEEHTSELQSPCNLV